MQIIADDKMHTFFSKCMHNIETDQKNQFLGMPVTKKNERNVIHQLRKAGFAEF